MTARKKAGEGAGVKLTPAEVRKRVERIRLAAGDDERAHADEDSLWADVLKAIRDGADDPAGLAREALETSKIEFERWCA